MLVHFKASKFKSVIVTWPKKKETITVCYEEKNKNLFEERRKWIKD